MLFDANILIYSADRDSVYFDRARDVVESALNGSQRVAIPWQTIGAFVRICTNPRVYSQPMSGTDAWDCVERWLERDVVWIPPAGHSTARAYRELATAIPITSNLVPDAMLAALAIEHGLELWSADTDFARFPGLRWRNPLIAGASK